MVKAYTERVGQFSKKEAHRAYARPLIGAVTVLIITAMSVGFLLGFYIGKPLPVALGITALIVVIAVIMPYLLCMLDRQMDRAARRRISLIRGAEAEVYVSVLMREALDDRWHLFDNLKLDATSDIDHVLIGPAGFFVISTKSHRGLFHCAGPNGESGPRFNLQPTPWPNEATQQVFRLKEQLNTVETARPPWIQAVLALPFARIESDGSGPIDKVGDVWVLHEDNLLRTIDPEPIPKSRKRLSQAEVDRWAAAVKKLHERHAKAVTVQG